MTSHDISRRFSGTADGHVPAWRMGTGVNWRSKTSRRECHVGARGQRASGPTRRWPLQATGGVVLYSHWTTRPVIIDHLEAAEAEAGEAGEAAAPLLALGVVASSTR